MLDAVTRVAATLQLRKTTPSCCTEQSCLDITREFDHSRMLKCCSYLLCSCFFVTVHGEV